MRADFESLHELLETLSLLAAEQRVGRYPEAVEGDFVFLHPAIAEHLDLAPRHALGRERVGVGSARLLGEQHREPPVALFVRVGADKQGHQVGPHRMGDPGLVSVDDVAVVLAHRAGPQGSEVGAGVGLGEDGGRQDRSARDARKVFLFLRLRSADQDEFGCDLGACAERADPDIAARQFLGNDAHGDLAEPHAAKALGDCEAEDAEIREARDHLERDVGVGAMPVLRVGDDLRVGEATHLAADRLERLVEAGVADRAVGGVADELGERGAVCRRIAAADQRLDRRRLAERPHLAVRKAEVGQPDDLALIHRQAAEDLGEVLAEADAGQKLLGPAEAALLVHPPRISRELADGFDISRKPGEAVDGVLLSLDPLGAELAVGKHPLADRRHRAFEEAGGSGLGLPGEVVERHGERLLRGKSRCCVAACVSAARDFNASFRRWRSVLGRRSVFATWRSPR